MKGMCVVRWMLLVSGCVGSLAAQAPQINAVLNGASFDQSAQAPPVAPGSIVSIFGSLIASELAGTATTTLSTSIPLQSSLGGVAVTFNGAQAPLQAPLFGVFGTPTFDQVNAQVPWNIDVSSGQVQMTVTRGAASTTMMIPAADASPGIFTLQFGPGPAIVTNFAFAGGPADVITGTFAQPPGTSGCLGLDNPPGVGCMGADSPSPVGGVVTIWCNGLGPVDVPVESGNIPPPGQVGPGGFVAAVKQVKVFIGGVEAQVLGAALTAEFVGLNQINVIVPNVPAGNAVPVQIEMQLNASGPTVRSRGDATMAVRTAP